MFSQRDEYWMRHAFERAKEAARQKEVPVGAVLVSNDEMLGEGFNSPIAHHDPSAHAEMIALRQAANKIQNYRLVNTTLYVTLEPCMMCAGALIHSRIQRLIFAAPDPKTGAIVSQARLLDSAFLNHRIHYSSGLLGVECGELLRDFFRSKR